MLRLPSDPPSAVPEEAPEEVPEGEEYPDRKGRMVPVLRENAEAAECLCLFVESEDGTLIYSLKTR